MHTIQTAETINQNPIRWAHVADSLKNSLRGQNPHDPEARETRASVKRLHREQRSIRTRRATRYTD